MISYWIVPISLTLLAVGSYLVWPSRWNIPAHLQLGFCITAYIIPVIGTDVLDNFSKNTVDMYVTILFWGTLFYLAGLFWGAKTHLTAVSRSRYAFVRFTESRFVEFISKRTSRLMLIGVVGVVISFIGMGFVPVFAEDPLAAKFFRGAYQESYRAYAPLFRGSMYLIQTLIPVALTVWYVTRRSGLLFLSILGATLIALSLTRGPVVYGILLFLGLVVAHRKKWFVTYIIFLVLIYPLGSLSYLLIANIFGVVGLAGLYDTQSIWHVIASGAPDISDQLQFMEAFLDHGSLTYGRTFFGGLIPYHFEWNPAVWALSVISAEDISEIISGGLRLPVSIWGYTAFGWIGVILVPLLSGFIWGKATHFAKQYIGSASIVRSIVVLMLYLTLGTQLSGFYALSMYTIPQIIISLLLIFPITVRVFGRTASTSPQAFGTN